MVDNELLPRLPFAGLASKGRFGKPFAGEPPVHLTERTNTAIYQLVAPKDGEAALAAIVKGSCGLSLPEGPRRVFQNGFSLIGTGPGQWLVIAESERAETHLQQLIDAVGHRAALVDLSHGKAVLRVSGPLAREVLAKGCSLDLHPSAFGPESAARTSIALMPCQLWQLDETPTYEIAVDTSYAASFWHWITGAAREFGYAVGPAATD